MVYPPTLASGHFFCPRSPAKKAERLAEKQNSGFLRGMNGAHTPSHKDMEWEGTMLFYSGNEPGICTRARGDAV